MEESTRLRRDLGFSAGVAANLVGLAYLSAELGRPDESGPLLDEAADLADRAGAAAVLTWLAPAETLQFVRRRRALSVKTSRIRPNCSVSAGRRSRRVTMPRPRARGSSSAALFRIPEQSRKLNKVQI